MGLLKLTKEAVVKLMEEAVVKLTEEDILTILDLGTSNTSWSVFAKGRLGHKLRNDQGETPKGFISYPSRYLVIVGEFTHEQVQTTLSSLGGFTPHFTLEVVVGETAMKKRIVSQSPEGAIDISSGEILATG